MFANTLNPLEKNKRTNLYRVLSIILIVALIAHLPLIISGFPPAHDTPHHVKWLYHFSSQFKNGDLYPRWLMGMSAGLGGPSFYYYPPASYYLFTAISYFIDPLTHGHYVLGMGSLLGAFIGAVGTYLFCSLYISQKASLFSAIVFLVIPYRITIDLYMRGSISELMSISIIPYVFFISKHIGGSMTRVVLVTAITTAAMVLTHPLIAMIVLPFAYAFKLLNALCAKTRKTLLALVYLGGLAIGLSLSSFYIIPAISVPNLASEGWDLFIVYDMFLLNNPMSPIRQNALLGIVSVLSSAAVAVIGWIYICLVCRKTPMIPLFFAICSILCTFMLFEISAPIYGLLAPLERIQFPWRYATILSIFSCFALGCLYDYHSSYCSKYSRLALAVILLLPITWTVLALFVGAVKSQNAITPQINLKNIELSLDAPEYRLSDLAKSLPRSFDKVSVSKPTDYVVNVWEENTIDIEGIFTAGSTVTVARQYFGNWRAPHNANALSVKNEKGLISIVVKHDVNGIRLTRDEFQAVRTGNILSSIALLFLVAIQIISWLRYKPTGNNGCNSILSAN